MSFPPDFLPQFSAEARLRDFSETVLVEMAAGPLVVWERPAPGPRIYLSAGIHGDEPAGPLALLELLKADAFSPDIHWLLCPALNPDGLAAGTRENATGLDLNRDYLLRLAPETRAHAAWIDSLPAPDLFVSLHEDWETSGFYLYEIDLHGDRQSMACDILTAVNPWFHPEPGPMIDGHEATADGWIYHAAEPDIPEGWPEAIHLAKRGCPLSFTFESPSQAGLDLRIAALAAGVRAACQILNQG